MNFITNREKHQSKTNKIEFKILRPIWTASNNRRMQNRARRQESDRTHATKDHDEQTKGICFRQEQMAIVPIKHNKNPDWAVPTRFLSRK